MGLQTSGAKKQAFAAVGSDVVFQTSRSDDAGTSQSIVADSLSQGCKHTQGDALVHPNWSQCLFLGIVSILFRGEVDEG